MEKVRPHVLHPGPESSTQAVPGRASQTQSSARTDASKSGLNGNQPLSRSPPHHQPWMKALHRPPPHAVYSFEQIVSFIRHSGPVVANTCSHGETSRTCWAPSSAPAPVLPCTEDTPEQAPTLPLGLPEIGATSSSPSVPSGPRLPTLQKRGPHDILGQGKTIVSVQQRRKPRLQEGGQRAHSHTAGYRGCWESELRSPGYKAHNFIPAFKAKKAERFCVPCA